MSERLWEQFQANSLPKEEVNILPENTFVNPVQRLALEARIQGDPDSLPVEEGSSPLGVSSAMERLGIHSIEPKDINPGVDALTWFQELAQKGLQQVQKFVGQNGRWPRTEIVGKTPADYTLADERETQLALAVLKALVRDPKNPTVRKLKQLGEKYGETFPNMLHPLTQSRPKMHPMLHPVTLPPFPRKP